MLSLASPPPKATERLHDTPERTPRWHRTLLLFQVTRAEPMNRVPGGYYLSFFCPACRDWHHHSWHTSYDHRRPQARCSHCQKWGEMAQYLIVPSDEVRRKLEAAR
jgi:hypothetical protein